MNNFYKFKNLKKLLYFNSKSQYLSLAVPSLPNTPVKLAYTMFGDDNASAPPLIIQHALFGSKINWRSICVVLKSKLVPKRKIYVVDARNHGDSPHVPEHTYEHLAADLELFMRTHHIEKATILGHSMGGRAVMYLILKYPKLVERAIIVDISPINIPSNIDEYKEILGSMRLVDLPSKLNLSEGRIKAKNQMKSIITNEFVLNFILQNLRKNESGSFKWALNIHALENYIDHISIFPEYILANQFENEVLFIAGKHSDFVNPNDWPIIQKSFPNSELVWVNSGHLVHIEQPEETVRLISNFLNH